MKKVAVVLAGCGYLDGSEIRESVLTLLALESETVQYTIFSPNKNQHHVVNHLQVQEALEASRNVLEESARIARGEIEDIVNLQVEKFDALVIPGGFGIAKNLCTFAFEGSAASIDRLVASIIVEFHSAKKPIGAICISPALIALSIGDKKPTLTIGSDQGTANELEKLGAQHQDCITSECVVDEKNKIVTTPAYMDSAAKLPDIFSGITKLVNHVIRLA